MYGTAEEMQRQQENEAADVHEAIMSGNAQAGSTVPEPKAMPTQSGRPALRSTPKLRSRPREDASRSRTRSPSPRPVDSTPGLREERVLIMPNGVHLRATPKVRARSPRQQREEMHEFDDLEWCNPDGSGEMEEIMELARWLRDDRDRENQASTAPARSEVPVPPWRQPSNAATTAAPDAAPAASRADATAEGGGRRWEAPSNAATTAAPDAAPAASRAEPTAAASWFEPEGGGRRGEAYRPRPGNPRGPRNGNRGGQNRRWYAARSLAVEGGWLDTFLRLHPKPKPPEDQ